MQRLDAPALPEWLARLVPFQRYCVEVGGQRMHVMEHGTGAPVLMLHGNPAWGFLYRNVMHALEHAGLRLIVPDLIGLGLSDKPRDASAHQLDAHARWIGALIDALDLHGVVFVGQDWGGPIGLRAFADRADRLAGLVVLNTVVGPPRPGFRPTAFHRFARVPIVSDMVFRLLDFPQRAMWAAQGDFRSVLQGDVARAYRYPLRGLRNNVAPLALARMVPDSLSHPSVAALEKCQRLVESFRGPAAVVWGDRDPVLGRVRGRIEKLLPQAIVTRTSAGHFLQEQVPEQIAAAIRDVAHRAAIAR